jgi:hypothetical protein
MQAHRRTRIRGWWLGAAVLALGAVWFSSRLTAQEAQEGPSALIQTGERPDFFLLYTGDVIGYVEPCG